MNGIVMKRVRYQACLLMVLLLLIGVSSSQAQPMGDWFRSTTAAQASKEYNIGSIESGTSLKTALILLEKRFQVIFLYQGEIIDQKDVKNTVRVSTKIEDAIKGILDGYHLSYKELNPKTYGIFSTEEEKPDFIPAVPAQVFAVKGQVTDASTGESLPGVNVLVKGTSIGTATDSKGNYSLDVPSANDTLIFSYIGYISKSIAINNQSVIDVQLSSHTLQGQQLVVIGYGAEQKKVLTGATVQVSGSKIAELNTVTTLGALQGSTPGVQLTKTDGQPGDSYKINIRGMGTIGNSTPLYVVDGVVVGSIDNLSPSDIKSVDVLKDATAAIYGSRAANGVILITTKHGQVNEKPTVTYNGYYGWQNVYRTANTLNAQQYLAIVNEGMVNAGQMPYNITKLAASLNGNDNGKMVPLVPNAAAILAGTNNGTNWMQAITNADAPVESHSLNVTGGSRQSTYSLGLSYMSQDGIFGAPVASHYDRYNVRINSDHILLTDSGNRTEWKIGENLTYSFNKKSGIAVSNGYWNDIYDMESANPFLPIYGTKGLYSYAIPWDHLQNNPIATMINTRGLNSSKNHNLMASFYTTVSPIKNLEFTSRFSSNISGGGYRSFQPTYDLGSVSTPTTAVGNSVNNTTQNMYVGLNWIWENTLSYQFDLNEDHSFTVLAGQSAEKDGLGENLSAQNSNSIFNSFQYAYLDNTPTISSTGGTVVGGYPWGKHQILSYFGRVNYNYRETYLLSAVVRADGSSNFAAGHRWGTFPAFSAGWIITSEPFMRSTRSWLDFLKIRASWGKNGNESISNFQYLSTIQTGGSGAGNFYTFGDKTKQSAGAYPNVLPNPDVTWETSTQTNIGFDANFLSSRLTLNFDLYDKETDGWLVQVPVPAVAGTNPAYVNGGNIVNKGYEINLGWTDHIGALHYDISSNFAYNHNEVTKIMGGGVIYGASGFYGNNSSWYVAAAGMPAGAFYGYKTDGIFQTAADVQAYKNKNGGLIQPDAVPGDIRFVDVNGDGKISDTDRTNIGNPHPPYTVGATINLQYKGFDFNLLGTGVAGNKIVQATDWNSLNDPLGNYTTGILNRWHGADTSNSMPRVSLNGNANNNNFSDMWLQSGDYFRISNITLGYDFKDLWRDIPLQKARLFLTIQNAYTFTKYRGMDPEVGYAPDSWSQGIDIGYYPSPRTFMLGMDLKF